VGGFLFFTFWFAGDRWWWWWCSRVRVV